MRIIIGLFCLLFSMQISYSQKQEVLDSIHSELEKGITQEEEFSAHRQLFRLYYKNNKIALAKDALDNLESVTSNDSIEIGVLLFTKSLYYSRISELDKGISFGEQALPYLNTSESQKDKSSLLSNLGLVQRRKGDYEKAIQYTLSSLRFKDSIGVDKGKIAFDYNLLAGIYGELKNYEESNRYFSIARDIYANNGNETFVKYMEMNLGTNYSALGMYDKARGLLSSCETYFLETNDINAYAQVLSDLGQLNSDENKTTEAEAYFRKVIALDGKIYNKEMIASNYNKLGEVLFNNASYAEALPLISKSLEMNKASGAINSLASNYEKMAKIYAGLKKYKKAYEFNELYYHLEDSLTGQKNLETVNALTIEYETEKKDAQLAIQKQEISLLEKENEVQSLTKTLYAIGMFSLLVIAGLLYFGFTQKIKKKNLENEKQQELFKTELNFKKKELTSQTLHLVKKNTFLQELKENLDRVKNAPEDFNAEFRRMAMLLKKETAEDKDWEVFKSYFSQVHSDFDRNIKQISDQVSEKEMRLASFLRMNLSTKEIASMFNVLPDSVLTSKYRLKKKLNIPKEDDLTSFLNSL